jgi:hypothetical protein
MGSDMGADMGADIGENMAEPARCSYNILNSPQQSSVTAETKKGPGERAPKCGALKTMRPLSIMFLSNDALKRLH